MVTSISVVADVIEKLPAWQDSLRKSTSSEIIQLTLQRAGAIVREEEEKTNLMEGLSEEERVSHCQQVKKTAEVCARGSLLLGESIPQFKVLSKTAQHTSSKAQQDQRVLMVVDKLQPYCEAEVTVHDLSLANHTALVEFFMAQEDVDKTPFTPELLEIMATAAPVLMSVVTTAWDQVEELCEQETQEIGRLKEGIYTCLATMNRMAQAAGDSEAARTTQGLLDGVVKLLGPYVQLAVSLLQTKADALALANEDNALQTCRHVLSCIRRCDETIAEHSAHERYEEEQKQVQEHLLEAKAFMKKVGEELIKKKETTIRGYMTKGEGLVGKGPHSQWAAALTQTQEPTWADVVKLGQEKLLAGSFAKNVQAWVKEMQQERVRVTEGLKRE